MVIVQKIRIKEENALAKAIKYYSVLMLLNNIHLAPMEINLLAFTALKGTISSGGSKKQFCEIFSSSKASIGNNIHLLRKKHLLTKVEGKVRVIPPLQIDFTHDLILNIKLL